MKSRSFFRHPLIVVGLLAAFVACAEAGGEVTGGQLTTAGANAANPPQGAVPEAGSDAPAPSLLVYGDGTGEGTKWSDLYRDYFGPTGRAGSCSLESSCHGADGAGAKSGSGIECVDEKGCRQSFIDKGVINLANDPAAPDKSGLFIGLLRLRTADGKLRGFMPKRPEGIFSQLAIDRMTTWIRDGAKDD